MRDHDLVAVQPVMIEKDPARRALLDIVDQVGCDRPRHLCHQAAGEPKQRCPNTLTGSDDLAQSVCADLERSA